MKKIIAVIIMLALLLLCACTHREEVSRELIDYDFTPAHEESIVESRTIINGDNVTIVPIITTHHFNDEYRLKYRITYDDKSTHDKWEQVTEHEYDNAIKELTGEE